MILIELGGITRALKNGHYLSASLSGDYAARVITLYTRNGNIETYGRAATLKAALIRANGNYGLGVSMQELEGSKLVIGKHMPEDYVDRWLLKGGIFEARFEEKENQIYGVLCPAKKRSLRSFLNLNEMRHGDTFDEMMRNFNFPRGVEPPKPVRQ